MKFIDGCEDVWNDCEKHINMCGHFYVSQYKCAKTCGGCKEAFKMVRFSENVCKYDAPCGIGAIRCEKSFQKPFYKCVCKNNYKGQRCEIENCPCMNGGKCLECSETECKCICPTGTKGKYCTGEFRVVG